ncbi:hypothetical protein IKN40_02635 [bacterium]|nr:hypothetical protein [bacterium]
MSHNKNRNKNNNDKNEKRKIGSDALEFAKITFKKYKKENDWFDSKKELKNGYFSYLVELLPNTLDWVVKSGHFKEEDVQQTKNSIYQKFVDPDFIKYLKKEIKNDSKIDNIKLMPICIKEIVEQANKENAKNLEADPNAKVYDLTDLVELSLLILKKRIKKMKNNGIEAKLAFDIASIIPSDSILKYSIVYRIKSFYDCLYEHAKTEIIPYDAIMKVLVDEDNYASFITFDLLEKKDRFARLTEKQQELYVAISNWCFNTMEKLSKNDIEAIISIYVKSRKKEDLVGKDSRRRYSLTSLSETDYPKIVKVIKSYTAENPEMTKYLS